MELDATREALERMLGEEVFVLEGAENVRGAGVLAYEHNTGRLSVYSNDGKQLRAFLAGHEIISYATAEHTYRIPEGGIRSEQ